ncbi:uncharacterized protein LOC143236320 [Tachypleus tridentatus]|uniref:uncharacterized protein LOC143236320 n=1 Tax=Tachypleus tridentatus TaxID=6853 RepID=UPI003FD16770
MDYFMSIFPTDTSDPTIYFGLHELQRLISKQGTTHKTNVVTFSSDHLKENIGYVIIITATNRFGGESYLPSTHRVKRVTKPLALTLLGPNVIEARHDVTFTVIVDICGELDMTTSSLLFKWSIFPSIVDLSGFAGTTATIPKGYLQLDNSYNVSVKVYLNPDQSQWRDVTRPIRLKRMNLQAIISSSNLMVGNQTSFKLDGALSSDPSNAAGKLQLLWSCTEQMSSGSSCFGSSVLVNEKALTIPAGELLPNTYLITLQVFKGSRFAQSQTTVTVREGELPVVYIKKRKGGRINPTERVVIDGYVTSRANVTLRWDVMVEREYALSSLEGVTSLVKQRNYSLSSVDRPFPLLIPEMDQQWAGLLGGAHYKFRLTAQPMDGGKLGYSDVIIETNDPPIGDMLEVEPLSGYALNTSFTLKAGEDWRDSPQDYPLIYVFSYRRTKNDVDTTITRISGAPPVVKDVVLPGVPGGATSLIVQVKVCDTLNLCITKERTVTIHTSSSWTADDFDLLNKTVLKYLNEGDQVRAFSVATAAALTLNSDQFGDLADRSNILFQDVVDKMAKSYQTVLDTETISTVVTSGVLNLMAVTKMTLQPNSLRDITQKHLADLTVSLVRSFHGSSSSTAGSIRRRKRRQIDSYTLPISPVEVNIMLGMNAMVTTAYPTTSAVELLFHSVNLYLSGICQYLVVGEDPVTIWTSLAAIRVEKMEFDALEGQRLTLASLDNGHNNHSIDFGSDLIHTFQTWSCDSDTCYGGCIGSAEIALETAVVIAGKVLLGPLIQIQLFNPKTGQQMTVENLSSPVTVTIPVEYVEIGSGQVIQCGMFVLTTSSWNTNTCVTTSLVSKPGILTCECSSLGYIGAILQDISTATIHPTTTSEPTTTSVPKTTAEGTTTSVPTTTAEATTTSVPTTTAEATTTFEPTTTAEATTTFEPTTTAEATTTSVPTTTAEATTTFEPTTTAEATTTSVPTTTTAEPTTTSVPTTTAEATTTFVPTTTAKPTTTSVPTTTTAEATTTFEPTTTAGGHDDV